MIQWCRHRDQYALEYTGFEFRLGDLVAQITQPKLSDRCSWSISIHNFIIARDDNSPGLEQAKISCVKTIEIYLEQHMEQLPELKQRLGLPIEVK